MKRNQVIFLTAVLVVLGAGWGMTQPLTKIAVSTGYKHFGLIFWQMLIGGVFTGAICFLRGRALPLRARHIVFYVMIAMLGTILPHTAAYQAVVHLPAGIVSILLSMVPMWVFAVALLMRVDRVSIRRVSGLTCGLLGVGLIIVPAVDIGVALNPFWVMVGLVSGLFYALESNIVAKWGTLGLDPLQVMCGASLVGFLIMVPVTYSTGQWIPPEAVWTVEGQAHIASSLIHVIVYTVFVWMLTQAGSVFAAQVSYLVTGFGLLWAHLILGESFSPMIWAALGCMFTGMYLVQPRQNPELA